MLFAVISLLMWGGGGGGQGECRGSVRVKGGGGVGTHGYGVIDHAGKQVLSFLFVHQATVFNTCFKKKVIHQQTWYHPKYEV